MPQEWTKGDVVGQIERDLGQGNREEEGRQEVEE